MTNAETTSTLHPTLVQGVRVRELVPLARALSAREVSIESLLESYEVDPHMLFVPEARIAPALMSRIWRRAARVTSPDIGLSAAAAIHPQSLCDSFPALHAASMSASVEEALSVYGRYCRLLHSSAQLRTEIQDEHLAIRINFGTEHDEDVGAYDEFWLLVLARLLEDSAAHSLGIVLEMQRARKERIARVGGIEVRSGRNCDRLLIPLSSLKCPLQTHLSLGAQLRSLLDRRVEKLAKPELGQRVRDLIRWRLGRETVRSHEIADALGTSIRTLHRRLDAEGVSFKQLLDEERAAQAKAMLLNSAASLDQVARHIGLSDSSTLSRAFRRWFGMTPGAFRTQRLTA